MAVFHPLKDLQGSRALGDERIELHLSRVLRVCPVPVCQLCLEVPLHARVQSVWSVFVSLRCSLIVRFI